MTPRRLNSPPAEPQRQWKSFRSHTRFCDTYSRESSTPCKVPVPFSPQHSHPFASPAFFPRSFPARRQRCHYHLDFTTRHSRVLCRYSRRRGWHSPLAIIPRGTPQIPSRPYFERKISDSSHLGSSVTPFFACSYDRRRWPRTPQVYPRTIAGPPSSKPLL